MNDRAKHADMRNMTQDVLKAGPSPDLLAKRDQKRDAALLRALKKHTGREETKIWLEDNAEAIESGEWKPELEMK